MHRRDDPEGIGGPTRRTRRMSYNLGINVVEVDGRATPSIQPAATSISGFIIHARRGVPGVVRRVTNWTQFVEQFGAHSSAAYGAYAIRGFFDNGGTTAYVTRVVRDTSVAATRTFNADASAALAVTAAYRGSDDPGAWGNNLSIRIIENDLESTRFDVIVRLGGQEVEVWEGLGMDEDAPHFVDDVLNDPISGSKYIRVEASGDDNPDETSGHGDADDDEFVPLQNGADEDFATEPSRTSALSAAIDLFDSVDIQLLACPETTAAGFVEAALTHCEFKNDRMFVGHTPEAMEAADIRSSYSGAFQAAKVYGALYFPWIQVAKPGGGHRWIPPTGHILGMYARTDRERGVWKAPAGNAARLNGALDVRFSITDTDHTHMVKGGSVNAVRFIPGQGIVVDSSRTLSTSGLWLYVNIRLLFNMVKSSLKSDLRWVVQEPNSEELWNKIKFNSVTPFLMGLWRRGAFGPGAPEDVFTVKCDEENNSPADIQGGRLNVEVYFYPSRPAETIVITVGQQEGGGSAGES
ncbi:MAG: hypothetical protein EA350_03765 [Gemmatimonadales bacterium]|nr:MAG: hypothetical protein EA350_03765 [Gemmatimonadales bacterium]